MTATATIERNGKTMQETTARGPETAFGTRFQFDDLDSRACKAAVRYLELKGYEVLDQNWQCDGDVVDIVCRDVDGTLVFVDVSASVHCFPQEECIRGRRARLEAMAMSYLAEYDEVDVAVRFDEIGIVPVSGNRAFLRHQVNALGAM